jgi:thioredoxin-related protein
MKRVLLALLLLSPVLSFAGGNDKKKAANAAAVATEGGIQWLSLDDVQVAMKKEARLVWFDVYTDWCGWCKHMDKTTFMNPNVVKYMNEHFYAVKLDAEQKTDIRFLGKMFPAPNPPQNRTPHPFATQLLQGQMSYPTSVVMDLNFQNPQIIPGYQDLKNIEMILKYFGEGTFKKTPWAVYQAEFKPSWM